MGRKGGNNNDVLRVTSYFALSPCRREASPVLSVLLFVASCAICQLLRNHTATHGIRMHGHLALLANGGRLLTMAWPGPCCEKSGRGRGGGGGYIRMQAWNATHRRKTRKAVQSVAG